MIFKETLIASAIVFLVFFLLSAFPLKFEFVKPIKQELNDFDIYDLVYSGINKDHSQRDTNIVLVQIADSREDIVEEVKSLNKYKPLVIGMDITFDAPSPDVVTDSVLSSELDAPNVVTGNKLVVDSASRELKVSGSFFDGSQRKNKSGYFNFQGEADAVVRDYYPFFTVGKEKLPAFTSQIAQQFNPAAFAKLEKQERELQPIRYTGNLENYTVFTKEDLSNLDSLQLWNLLHNKIVLLGILYTRPPLVLEDLHFTPVNEKVQGKSYPDMYGLVIHANILSMILSGVYPRELSAVLSYLIAFVITFLLVYYQLKLYQKKAHPNHLRLVLLQFVLLIVFIYLSLLLFKYAQVKVPLLSILLCIALSVETLNIYKFLALWLHKKINYQTVFQLHRS